MFLDQPLGLQKRNSSLCYFKLFWPGEAAHPFFCHPYHCYFKTFKNTLLLVLGTLFGKYVESTSQLWAQNVFSAKYTLHNAHYTLYTIVYTVRNTIHSKFYTFNNSYYTLLTQHCTPPSFHETLHTTHYTTLHTTVHSVTASLRAHSSPLPMKL